MGLTMAQEVKRSTDSSISISVQSTGGFDANIRQVGGGAIDLGASTTPNFQAAAAGVTPFEQEFTVTPMFTCATFPFPIAFTTTATDVDFIADTEGKKVATGAPGSSVHTYYRLFMLANGLDWESVEPVRVDGQEAFQNLIDGQVSAVLTAGINNVISPQARQFLQTSDNPKLVVPETDERINRLVNANEHIEGYPLSGGVDWTLSLEQFGTAWENSARSDEEAYPTVAGTNTHMTTLSTDDETVKTIVNTAIENRQALADSTALWGAFAEEPERFASLLPQADAEAQPFHPGAVEALKEHDLWNDSFPVAER
jgi:TRAP-type uncharacterized transport system substrate-binding protein